MVKSWFIPVLHLLLMHIEFLIEAIHQAHINKNKCHEDVNGALLGKPETQFKASESDTIQPIDEQNPESIGDEEPYGQQNSQIAYILLPIVTQIFSHSLIEMI